MRVLHITSGNLFGGVETVLDTFARYRHLCPEMEPDFAVCFEDRLSNQLREEGVAIHSLGQVRARNPLSIRRARAELGLLLNEHNFDVAICHMEWPLAMFGPAVRSAGIPLVYWSHTSAGRRHWLNYWAKRIRPDLVIYAGEYISRHPPILFPGVHSEVIHYPVVSASVDRDARERVRKELGTPSDATVIIQVSRMQAWKGHALHLKALGGLKDIPDWICWIVGGPQRAQEQTYFETLRAMANDVGIADRVRFTGQRGDVAELLSAADIFCQPNEEPEPFGLVFIEAMSQALPVVATKMGGALEIVDRTCGILTPPDPIEVANAERALLLDPERRRSLGVAGKSRAAALCGAETQMRQIFDALMSVAQKLPAAKASSRRSSA